MYIVMVEKIGGGKKFENLEMYRLLLKINFYGV